MAETLVYCVLLIIFTILASEIAAECESFHFPCADNNTCIGRSKVCNGKNDCLDGSDERGCILPKIIEHPDIKFPTVVMERNVLELKCRATGFPTPQIDFYHLCGTTVCGPAPERSNVQNKNGEGILKLRKVEIADAGGWRCGASSKLGINYSPKFNISVTPRTI